MKKFFALFISMLIVLLSACRPAPSFPAITQQTPPAEPTRTLTALPTPTGTLTPTLAVTPSRTPFPTQTPTSTPTPTQTPHAIDLAGLEVISVENVGRIIPLQGHYVKTEGLQQGLAFSPDGKYLAVSDDTEISIWDVTLGNKITSFVGNGRIAFSPDGKWFAGVVESSDIRLLEVGTWRKIHTFKNTIYADVVTFSPDSQMLVIGLYESIAFWDIATQKFLPTSYYHDGLVSEIFFAPDGQMMVSGGGDNRIRFWNLATGQEIRALRGNQLAMSRDGRLVSARLDLDTIQLWNAETGQELKTLTITGEGIIRLAFSPDGRLLGSANIGRTITLWNTGTGELINTLSGYSSEVWELAFSPDGKMIATVDDAYGLVIIWGVPDEKTTGEPYSLPASPTPTATLDLVPQINTQCQAGIRQLPASSQPGGTIILDSRVIVNGRYTGSSYLLDLPSCEVKQMNGVNEGQSAHFVSPNRQYLAYERYYLKYDNVVVKKSLELMSSDGHVILSIPWEKQWEVLLGWLDNDHLIIHSPEPEEQTYKDPSTKLILNPFTDKRQLFHPPNYPDFLTTSILPPWEGWYGIIYDPAFTRAIYPRYLSDDKETFTYALWNLSSNGLITTLEDAFWTYSLYTDIFPRPFWSPDGSQFVFRGVKQVSDDLVEFELFRVGRDGQIEQLTDLTLISHIDDQNLSWSPDGRYIAMFLNPWGQSPYETAAHLAVLDTVTLEIKDFNVLISEEGSHTRPPIWSPDGNYILIFDSANEQTLFVDLAQNIAIPLVEDMEPVGWMLAP